MHHTRRVDNRMVPVKRLPKEQFKIRSFLFAITTIFILFSLVFIIFQFNQPLAVGQTIETLESDPQFDIDVFYSYVGNRNVSTPHSHFNDILMYPRTLYPSKIYFNLTRVSDSKTESYDAKLEVYQLQLITDTGIKENYALFAGTNYKEAFSDLESFEPVVNLENLIDLEESSGIIGCFSYNWTVNHSITGKAGSYGSYSSRPSSLGLWSAGEPNTITITIQRKGWIILENSNISKFANADSEENIVEIELEKFGNGLLYNRIVENSELSEIEPFDPPI